MQSAGHYEPPATGWRTFVILWVSQTFSLLGSGLTAFAMTVWLAQVLFSGPGQEANISSAVSALVLAKMAPIVLIGAFAGAWADRTDRKRIMIIMDAVSGLLSLVLVTLLLTNSLELWSLVILVALLSVANTFHVAAFDASYVMLIPTDRLPRANGMMETMHALSGILAPGIAAIVIALPALASNRQLFEPLNMWLAQLSTGVPLVIALDMVTFFVGALVLVFLHIPSPTLAEGSDGQPQQGILASALAGGKYIVQHRPLLWLLLVFMFANLVSAPLEVFEPLIVKFRLAADWMARGFSFETALAFVATCITAGGLIGGFAISTWGGLRSRRVFGVLVPMIVAGAAMILFGFSQSLYLTAAAGLVFVAMIPIANAHLRATIQLQTPPEFQGRVLAARRVIANATTLIALSLAGLVGGVFDIGSIVMALGTVFVAFCAALLFNTQLIRSDEPVAPPEVAPEPAVAVE